VSFVTAEILDDADRVIPDAIIPIRFSITGNAQIEATGNANPADMASFKPPQRNTFRGRCLAIVRPTGKAGTVILKAESDSLNAGQSTIITK
jgi:beta-galactosidase